MAPMMIFCLAILLFFDTSIAQRSDGQYWPCNPLKNATGACTPNRGLASRTYSVDFTKQTALPQNWSISNYATINHGSLGAEFTFAKRYDAPQIWTDFYILFGKVKIVMQVANGAGIISSAVLISDVFDEIDYEFSGNNFGNAGSTGLGQNNYFGKGITGTYDRGSYFNVTSPQYSFHTYEVDWTPNSLTWSVDGNVVRTLLLSQTDNGTHQYPQTPSKLQLGLWDGGDPDQNSGTRAWAGGVTNFTAAPFTFYVKSVEIENMYPAVAYNYTDQSGLWQSVQLLQSEPIVSSTLEQLSVSLNAPVANSTVANTFVSSGSITGMSPSSGIRTMIPATSTPSSPSKASAPGDTASNPRTVTSSVYQLDSTMSAIPGGDSTSRSSMATAQTFSSVNSSASSPDPTTRTTCNETTAASPVTTSRNSSKSSTSTSIQTRPKTASATTSTKCASQIQPELGWLGWLAGHGAEWNRWGMRYGRLPVFRVDHA